MWPTGELPEELNIQWFFDWVYVLAAECIKEYSLTQLLGLSFGCYYDRYWGVSDSIYWGRDRRGREKQKMTKSQLTEKTQKKTKRPREIQRQGQALAPPSPWYRYTHMYTGTHAHPNNKEVKQIREEIDKGVHKSKMKEQK